MKTITWDLEDAPIKFPKEVRSIFDKVFIHNRKNFTLWIDKLVRKIKMILIGGLPTIFKRSLYQQSTKLYFGN